MPFYRYAVLDQNGNMRVGTSESEDAEMLVFRLQEQGLQLDKIEQVDEIDEALDGINRAQASFDDILVFWIQFSIMIDARVSRSRALDVAAEHAATLNFSTVLYSVSNQVMGGTALHNALERYPSIFDAHTIGIIRAGEVANALPDAVHRLIQYLQRDGRRERATPYAPPA